MAADDQNRPDTETLPFGAMERPEPRRKRRAAAEEADSGGAVGVRPGRAGGLQPIDGGSQAGREAGEGGGQRGGDSREGKDQRDHKDWRKPHKRRGGARRGGRRRRKNREGQQQGEGGATAVQESPPKGGGPRPKEPRQEPARERKTGTGMFVLEKGGFGTLRSREEGYAPSKKDIFVAQRLVQKNKLRDGAIVSGPIAKGKKHKFQLLEVKEIDGKHPKEHSNVVGFKNLTTIDPDFHYAVGDVTGEGAMRALDIIAPIGRGQRALIVAAPRTGKTTILRQFAKGIEEGYPEVHLMVLLIDERPEEATEWVRSTKGEVYVSTSDEMPKKHVQLAEAVWRRCQRLVELGEDVVLLLDSITRLARAYNNHAGQSGKTMSGGLDSRAMERRARSSGPRGTPRPPAA